MSGDGGANPRPGTPGGRCVLYEAGAPTPTDLARLLERRGLDVRRCTDAYAAMAEIALHERGLRNGEPRIPAIVLLVEPDEDPMAVPLAESVERHAPHAVVWRFSADAEPQLQAFQPPREVPEPVAPPRPQGQPLLRLALHDEDEAPAPDTHEDEDEEGGGLPELTDEELSMLLDGDLEDGKDSQRGLSY